MLPGGILHPEKWIWGTNVLPGIVSLHNHFSIVFPFRETVTERVPRGSLRCEDTGGAQDALQGGVTTVRSTGETHRVDMELRKMISSKWINSNG